MSNSTITYKTLYGEERIRNGLLSREIGELKHQLQNALEEISSGEKQSNMYLQLHQIFTIDEIKEIPDSVCTKNMKDYMLRFIKARHPYKYRASDTVISLINLLSNVVSADLKEKRKKRKRQLDEIESAKKAKLPAG